MTMKMTTSVFIKEKLKKRRDGLKKVLVLIEIIKTKNEKSFS